MTRFTNPTAQFWQPKPPICQARRDAIEPPLTVEPDRGRSFAWFAIGLGVVAFGGGAWKLAAAGLAAVVGG